jgi:NHLM bacteriocin system ABC transporter ATP-binding protein
MADMTIQEYLLSRLRAEEAGPTPARGNQPILLDDKQLVWLVYIGRVDIFAISVRGGEVVGPRHHLFRAEAGQAIFGIDLASKDNGIALLAVGGPETELLPLQRSQLAELVQEQQDVEAVVALINRWITDFSSSLATDIPPKESQRLTPDQEIVLAERNTARPRQGILWVKHREGQTEFMGRSDLSLRQDGFIPLSNRTWLRSVNTSRLYAVDTRSLLEQDAAWSALDHFHQLALEYVRLNMTQTEQAERQYLQEKLAADRSAVENAFSQLTAVLESETATPFVLDDNIRANPLLVACSLVGQALGLAVQAPPDLSGSRTWEDALRDIARASRIRYRQVALRGAWWRMDNGPLLARLTFAGGTEGEGIRGQAEPRPVALWPTSTSGYEILDPTAQTRQPVTPEIAAALAPLATMLYRPLPNRAITALDLLKFGLWGTKKDLLTVLFMGLAAGLLGLVPPVMTGILFDVVIPRADRSQLWPLGLALLIAALAVAMFQLVQNMAVLRLEGKLEASIQPAIWDRLLQLPARFFRQYSAGDLADRAMGVNTIQRILSRTAITSVLSGMFSIFSFGLLFYYDFRLALVASGLIFIFVTVTLSAGYFQVRYQRTLANHQGQIASLVLQFITGMAKFRIAGIEERAFALWARAFSEQRKIAFKARTVANSLAVFNAAYPILASLVIFAALALINRDQARLSTGAFLAFNTAFIQLLFASLAVSSAFISVLKTVPIYERVKPILQTQPEVHLIKSHPGELRGEIDVNRVAFRYKDDEPLVLKDLSLHINAGEFVAIVGPSGCGKSTLLRLLLGFETPLSGAIYYDDHDLAGLDIEAVRRQLGVVLQDGQLIAGDIFSNIVGSSSLTIGDAWAAARLVGLEAEIAQMPMGMHTIISPGGGNLSGGQRQRLLIARAIANKPRILFFDEATSALDNLAQAVVSQSLERLHATRVVIAHRLSTVIHADRIYVIDEGRVVERGTYEALIQRNGLFAELAERQLI